MEIDKTQPSTETQAQSAGTAATAAPTTGAAEPAKTPWYERRIGVLTAQKREAEDERQRLLRENEMLRAAQPQQTQTQTNGTVQPLPAQEINQRIRTEAERIATARQFDRDCDQIFDAGAAEYKDFADRTGNFAKIGGIQQTPQGPSMAPGYVSMIEAAQQTGIAHKVLYELGGNMDEAARIMGLPPVRQAVEITKLAQKISSPPVVSKAPAPITPIDGTSTAEPDPETMPLGEWMKWREKQIEARRKRA